MTIPIGLPDLLDLLGYQDGELVQLAHKSQHRPFSATVVPFEAAQDTVNGNPPGDQWFGVNPVRDVDEGRPGAADVTRLAAVWADLDVKPAGCPTIEVAERIVDELSAMLGARPVAVTQSGHGLQPLWAVEDAFIAGPYAPAVCEGHWNVERDVARALLRRWGRLVATVAERFGSRVDTVFDLPRILRVPGTVNYKTTPAPVRCLPAGGAPISVERLLEVLDEYGIADLPEDHDDPGTIVSAPAEWAWATRTCGYAEKTMQAWARDEPADRHPWLVAQATRIACLHRNGCLTEFDHSRAVERLITRFRVLLARSGAGREPGRGEIADALGWGQQRAAAMPASRLAEEMGNHQHKGATDGKHERDSSTDHAHDGTAPAGTGPAHQDRESPARSLFAEPAAGLPSGLPNGADRVAGPRSTLRDLIRQAEASEVPTGSLTGLAGMRIPDLLIDAHTREGTGLNLLFDRHYGDTWKACIDAPAATVQPTFHTWAQPGDTGPLHREIHAEPELTPEQAQLKLDVADAARRLQVATEARALERARQAGAVVVPKPTPLGEFLARPMPDAQYRIAGLLPTGGRVVVSAQFKSGKSVMMGNLVRALADGDPFLGAFTVAAPTGRIVLLDDELDERTLHRWLGAQGIVNVHNVEVISLRGRVSSFDLTNESIRAEWARNLKAVNCGFLVFDCLRPVLDAIGLSEDKESGAFLVALDALALDAGVSEMAVVHHMGHSSERARGDSRLRDWPDVEWKIVRESAAEDDPAAPRYFSAFGRDVDVAEGRLDLDNKRLSFRAGEARKKTSRNSRPELPEISQAIEDVLCEAAEPLSKRALRMVMKKAGYTDPVTREAIEALVAGGLVKSSTGARGAHMLRWHG